MISIELTKQDIELAKSEAERFNSFKTWNKYKCCNSWMGFVAERKFNGWLLDNELNFTWFAEKDGYANNPDFLISGLSVDIKTTTKFVMFVDTKIKFDLYVFSRINEQDLKYLYLVGFVTRKDVVKLINAGKCRLISYADGNKYYEILIEYMKPIEGFAAFIEQKKGDENGKM